MSNLESIVPRVEFCKLIPSGEFEDSALVWDIHGKFDRWHVEKRVKRSVRFGDYGRMSPPHADISAPTLEEILDALADLGADFCQYEFQIGNKSYCYPTGMEEALLLWFEVKGIEVK